MPPSFPDRSRQWLGLPHAPRHFYDLLGLAIGAADPVAIRDAARQMQVRLEQVPASERGEDWQTLARQIQLALQTLTTESLREPYDRSLHPQATDAGQDSQAAGQGSQPAARGMRPVTLHATGNHRAPAEVNLDLGKSERRFTIGSLTGVPGAGKAPVTMGPLTIQAVPGKTPSPPAPKASAESPAVSPTTSIVKPKTAVPKPPAAGLAPPAQPPQAQPPKTQPPAPVSSPASSASPAASPAGSIAKPKTPAPQPPTAAPTRPPQAPPAPAPSAPSNAAPTNPAANQTAPTPRAEAPAPNPPKAASASPAISPTASPAISPATSIVKPGTPASQPPAAAQARSVQAPPAVTPPAPTPQAQAPAPAPPKAASEAPAVSPAISIATSLAKPKTPPPTSPASATIPPVSVTPTRLAGTSRGQAQGMKNTPGAKKPSAPATRERTAPAKLEIRIPSASEQPAVTAASAESTASMPGVPAAGPQDPTLVPPPPRSGDAPATPPVPRRRAPRPRTQATQLPWWATLLGLIAFATVMGSLYFAVNHWMKPRQEARKLAPNAEPTDASELPLPEVKPRPQPAPQPASTVAVNPAAKPDAPPAIAEPKPAATPPVNDPPAKVPPAEMPPLMDGPGVDMVREPDSVDAPLPAAPETPPASTTNEPPTAVPPPMTTPAEPPPATAEANEMQAPETPRELESDAQRQVLSKLKLARRAVVERRLEEARKALEAAGELAAGSTLEPPVTRLSLITDHVDQFWQAFEEGLKDLGGQEITINGKLASVIEVRPKELLVRIEGRNRKFNRERLPTGIAIAIADRSLKPDAGSSDVFRGAYLAVQSSSDRAKVLAEWKKAEKKGVPIDELIPFLDDRYETAAPRRSRTRGTRAAGETAAAAANESAGEESDEAEE